MQVARPLKAAAVAALSSMVAAIAIAGPLAGNASAAPKKPVTPIPAVTANATVLDSAAKWLPGSQRTNSQSIQFSWPAPTAAGTTLTCSVDGGKATQSCTSPSPIYQNLASGTHNFVLKGKATNDRPGSSTFTWTVDTTAPLQPTVSSELVTGRTANDSVLVSWSDTDVVSSYLCQLFRDGAADATTPAPVACGTGGHAGSKTFTGLSDNGVSGAANYVAKVWARDDLDNPRTLSAVTPGSVSWVVDRTAPRSPMFDAVPGNPTNTRAAHFVWHATDYPNGSITSFNCFLNGVAAPTCAASGTDLTLPTDGTFTFSVQGVDAASNVGDPASYTWTVLTAKPAAPFLTNYPPSTTDQTSASFSFGDTQAGVTYLCALESQASFSACQA